MKRLLAVCVSLVLSLLALAGPASAAPAYSPDGEELAFLGLINDYRAQHGLGALSLNTALGAAADFHSQDMAEHGYFAHTLSDGTDAGTNIYNHGYTGSTWGENIAAGMATAQEAMASWKASPGHDSQMRNAAFQEIGIGRYYDANSAYGWYWTTTFGGGASIVPPTSQPGTTVDEGGQPAAVVAETNEPGTVVLESEQPVAPASPASTTTSVDGATVTATDEGNPVAEGGGPDLVLDDITTGGVTGDTTTYVEQPPPDPAAVTTEVVPPASETVTNPDPAPVDGVQETITTTTSTEDGVTDSLVMPPAPAATEPGPDANAAAPAASCGGYATWYDAQVAYEAAGALAADPAYVAAVDPDADGIACEEAMLTA